MATSEERLTRMHARAGEIRKQRTRRKLQIESAVTGALGVFMIAMLVVVGTSEGGFLGGSTSDTGYAGATMLDGTQVGGYILIGVIAFLFGAALVVLIRTYREKKRLESDGEKS